MNLVGDGVQTPVRGAEARRLREEFANRGMSFNPAVQSRFHIDIICGAHEEVRRSLDQVGSNKDRWREYLQRRGGDTLRLSPLHLVVIGKQRIVTTDREQNHLKTAQLLLERGADVNARDCNGYTALHHATSAHPELEIARLLIEAGADVNAKNRMGCVPLVEAAMTGSFDACELLLKAGADPNVADNDGHTAVAAAEPFPKILALLLHGPRKAKKNSKKKSKGSKEAGAADEASSSGSEQQLNAEQVEGARENQGDLDNSPGGDKQCAKCGEGKQDLLQCARCRSIAYCGKECQISDWRTHKLQCAKTQETSHAKVTIAHRDDEGRLASLLPVAAVLNTMNGTSRDTDELRWTEMSSENPARRARRKFTVKVQVPMMEGYSMVCYDETRTFQCNINRADPQHDRITNLIRSKGVQGLKGYFKAFLDDDEKLTILTNEMLPAQPW